MGRSTASLDNCIEEQAIVLELRDEILKLRLIISAIDNIGWAVMLQTIAFVAIDYF